MTTLTRADVEIRVIAILAEASARDLQAQPIKAADHLDDLGLDSLDLVEVSVGLDDAFGIDTAEADLGALKSVADVVDLACRLLDIPSS